MTSEPAPAHVCSPPRTRGERGVQGPGDTRAHTPETSARWTAGRDLWTAMAALQDSLPHLSMGTVTRLSPAPGAAQGLWLSLGVPAEPSLRGSSCWLLLFCGLLPARQTGAEARAQHSLPEAPGGRLRPRALPCSRAFAHAPFLSHTCSSCRPAPSCLLCQSGPLHSVRWLPGDLQSLSDPESQTPQA